METLEGWRNQFVILNFHYKNSDSLVTAVSPKKGQKNPQFMWDTSKLKLVTKIWYWKDYVYKKSNSDLKFWIFWKFSQFYVSFEILKNKKVEKTPQKHEKIETNQFNTDLIVSK